MDKIEIRIKKKKKKKKDEIDGKKNLKGKEYLMSWSKVNVPMLECYKVENFEWKSE